MRVPDREAIERRIEELNAELQVMTFQQLSLEQLQEKSLQIFRELSELQAQLGEE